MTISHLQIYYRILEKKFNMSRLLQVIAGAPTGGAEAFFIRLAIAFQDVRQDQKIVIRRHQERSILLRSAQVDIEELTFGGFFDVLTTMHLRKLAKTYRPDIVLTWMNRATRKMPSGPYTHVARLGGYYSLKHYKNCDHLIGNTRKIVDYLVDAGWPSARAHYIPNFATEEVGVPIKRSSFRTPEGVPIILALGRLHENKGFDVLMKSLAILPDVYLWLAGSGSQQKTLENLAADLGVANRVRFLGWREDIADLLTTADALVCPSRHEPLGNVILEAWVQGKPVVAAASDGPRQILSDGENGLLCGIDEPKSLANAITRIISDGKLAKKLGESGRKTYETHFTKENVVKQYREFFDYVLK